MNSRCAMRLTLFALTILGGLTAWIGMDLLFGTDPIVSLWKDMEMPWWAIFPIAASGLAYIWYKWRDICPDAETAA